MGMNEAKYQLNDLFREDDKILILRDPFDFGAFIKDYQKRNKMNRSQLARKAGVSANALKLWEDGERIPSISSVVSVTRSLGVNKVIIDNGDLS